VQYRYAAARDPLWAEPWLEQSRIHYERWLATRGHASEEQFGHAVAALDAARRLAPSSLEPVRVLAGLYEARAERDSVFWDKAADAYQQCTEMYPTSASLHARLARALLQAGRTDAAREAAHRASQLDSQMPHADRKLTELERAFIEPLQAP
jgi:tetratricopeptide (TPR) repeat protein